ncbi:type VII secretion integral membrane protein EccD [Mycobacterium sp. 050134]|uniref:type VII secretion integral membrane protein EccD n=1 Tax=Mycobacterium sp. 050134 TaxID=3096111 RepID=UPI002EDA34C7
MSAPTAARTTASTTTKSAPAKPPVTRVTILTGKRMTDVVLPPSAPIESYIDETVTVLASLLEGTPAETLAEFDFSAQGAWTFARPGAPPINPDQSLDEAEVVDGSLLLLVSVSRTERYRPLVEDVIDAIAVLDESPSFDRPALNRFVHVAIPVVTLALTTLAALAWSSTGRPLWWSIALGIGGIALLAGSWAAGKFYQDVSLAESLLVAAFPFVSVAVALAIPRPRGVDSIGAPQIAGGAAAILLLVMLTRGGPRGRHELASFTTIAAFGATVAAIAFGYGWQRWVPAGAIIFGLFTVTNAAKLTVAVARIALPPVPAPGEIVEHDELLDPVAADHVSETDETRTWRAIAASVPTSAVRLTERSRLAKQLLNGYVTAGSALLATGAITVVVRGHFLVHTLVLAGLVTTMCGFRSRLFADRWCAWSLLAATVVIPLGVTAKLTVWNPYSAWWLLTILLATAVVALGVVGATVEVRRISPVMKRILELLDGLLVTAIIPILLWVTGVYDAARNVQF